MRTKIHFHLDENIFSLGENKFPSKENRFSPEGNGFSGDEIKKDFSWLERRWPGAGYEDWDRVLDELTERGYNAIRIDPSLTVNNEFAAKLLRRL